MSSEDSPQKLAGSGSYAPALRGPQAVGVRTAELRNPRRDNQPFTVEIWYPARASGQEVDEHDAPPFGRIVDRAERDASAAPGPFPLVLLSHEYCGGRRQLSYLASHLASHGYVTAAPDHEHLTLEDVQLHAFGEAMWGRPPSIEPSLRRVIWQHPCELWATACALRDGLVAGLTGRIDARAIAVGGHGVGAWVAMKAAREIEGAKALLLLAPVGGNREGLAGSLSYEEIRWWSGADALLIAAAEDAVVPLETVEALYERLPAPKRLAVLARAEHFQLFHLGDATHAWLASDARATKLIPTLAPPARPTDLAPASEIQAAVRALVLAACDASLRDDPRGAQLLSAPAGALDEGRLAKWLADVPGLGARSS